MSARLTAEQIRRADAYSRALAGKAIKAGDKVLCLGASIDKQIGLEKVGTVGGFARLSSYHPREAMVRFDDGIADWFWCRDLQLIEAVGGEA